MLSVDPDRIQALGDLLERIKADSPEDLYHRVLRPVLDGTDHYPAFTVGEGWPPSSDERALLASATGDEISAALELKATELQVKGEQHQRAANAFTAFLDRFPQWEHTGLQLREFVESLPDSDRADAVRLLREMTDAGRLTGTIRTAEESHHNWLEGKLAVIERNEDGDAIRWQTVEHFDQQVLTERAVWAQRWVETEAEANRLAAEPLDPDSQKLVDEARARFDTEPEQVAFVAEHASDEFRNQVELEGVVRHMLAFVGEKIDEIDQKHGIRVDGEGLPV